MILSRFTLKNINPAAVSVPPAAVFELPEKVLQFGTGVLLRGLPDYFIDKANRQGIFNGRVVVVKSTAHGDTAAFDKQDGLYTVCIRGVEGGNKTEENIINASISRVLNAADDWAQVLQCAHNSELRVILSNTTEVGIQLEDDDVRLHPPKTFPGKLLSFLYERYTAFGGSKQSGFVIVPTELIPDNGTKLLAIVLELAHLNGLDGAFLEWVENSNHFCNSLVDRIVPGKPETHLLTPLQEELGYTDELLTMSEVYRLWAIEGGDEVRNILSFAAADDAVVITPNIEIYRELKLRMLNGTHTLSCGLAYLAGCDTVKEAMDDPLISVLITNLMQTEIAPAIPYNIESATTVDFGNKVLDRFRNPHIQHHWINITMNFSSKLRLRCVPMLVKHYEASDTPPPLFSLGFAAYIAFMKGIEVKAEKYYGARDGVPYWIQDGEAEVFFKRWSGLPVESLVREVLGDTAYWGTDLNALPGFTGAVTGQLSLINTSGVREAIAALQSKKELAA
jgi:tagaturonate reductase